MGLNIAQAIQKFATAAQRLPGAVRDAEQESGKQLLAAAVKRSQGPLQAADEKRMGHPYARRRLRLNPDIINRWSGGFERGWKIDPPKFTGGKFTATLRNTNIKAAGLEQGLVFGQPLMAPRHPGQAAYEDVKDQRAQRLAGVWEVIFR